MSATINPALCFGEEKCHKQEQPTTTSRAPQGNLLPLMRSHCSADSRTPTHPLHRRWIGASRDGSMSIRRRKKNWCKAVLKENDDNLFHSVLNDFSNCLKKPTKVALFFSWAEELEFQLAKIMFGRVFSHCIRKVPAREQYTVLCNTFLEHKDQLKQVQRASPAASVWNNQARPLRGTGRRAREKRHTVIVFELIKSYCRQQGKRRSIP